MGFYALHFSPPLDAGTPLSLTTAERDQLATWVQEIDDWTGQGSPAGEVGAPEGVQGAAMAVEDEAPMLRDLYSYLLDRDGDRVWPSELPPEWRDHITEAKTTLLAAQATGRWTISRQLQLDLLNRVP